MHSYLPGFTPYYACYTIGPDSFDRMNTLLNHLCDCPTGVHELDISARESVTGIWRSASNETRVWKGVEWWT